MSSRLFQAVVGLRSHGDYFRPSFQPLDIDCTELLARWRREHEGYA